MAKIWGDWENQEQIGEGGGGTVFKVKNTKTGVVGALKRLKNVNRIDRFKKEVEAVDKLNHVSIIRLLDTNLEQDPFYAVYEYEQGGSLADISIDEMLKIPLAQRMQLCEQICSALHAAHHHSLIHRDVKPANILVSTDRKVARLCDFGLVYCEGGERHTAAFEQVGSRYYIPPELEDGRADNISSASDIYSMGKVLYYVLTGNIYAHEKHREPKYDLETIYKNPYFEAVSRILDQAVTSVVETRLNNAIQMSGLINSALNTIESCLPIDGVPKTYRCIFCQKGVYQERCVSTNFLESQNSGYKDEGNSGGPMVFLECNNCGNCQRFRLSKGGERWFPVANKATRAS